MPEAHVPCGRNCGVLLGQKVGKDLPDVLGHHQRIANIARVDVHDIRREGKILRLRQGKRPNVRIDGFGGEIVLYIFLVLKVK